MTASVTSERLIERALFTCLAEIPWHKLTVSQVCRTAGVARKTFYRHFDSLQTVVARMMERLAADYLATQVPAQRFDSRDVARAFFEFWQPYREQLALLQRSGLNLSGLLMPYFVGTVQARSSLPLFSIYSAGGFLAMLELFVQQPHISAHVMTERFASEFNQAVSAE